MPRKKKISLPTSTTAKTPIIKEEPTPIIEPIVIAQPEPKDELKELKKTMRKLLSEKPVLPYPEEVRLQPWIKRLEDAVQ